MTGEIRRGLEGPPTVSTSEGGEKRGEDAQPRVLADADDGKEDGQEAMENGGDGGIAMPETKGERAPSGGVWVASAVDAAS